MLHAVGVRPEEYYVFKLEDKPVGYAVIGMTQEEAEGKMGEIHALYFLPRLWGTGCAAEAMVFCLSRLREQGFGTVALWVLEDNRKARRFYEKHGFRFSGLRKEIHIGKPLCELRYIL